MRGTVRVYDACIPNQILPPAVKGILHIARRVASCATTKGNKWPSWMEILRQVRINVLSVDGFVCDGNDLRRISRWVEHA